MIILCVLCQVKVLIILFQVKVHRTESHHERFNSARALFERIGSGDNLLEESSRGTSR